VLRCGMRGPLQMMSLVVATVAVIGCGRGSGSSRKPAGTATDPVEVCERMADVCRLDRSRLGVCSPNRSGPGLTCMPQH